MRPGALRHVLLTTDAVGGVWTFTRSLTRALVQSGVDCTLAVLGPAASPAMLRAFERNPVAIHHHPGRLEWMPGADADVRDARRWLVDLAQRTRPDIVHVNGYAYAAGLFRRPVLVTAHSCVCSWWRAVHGHNAPAAEWRRYRRRVQAGLDAAGVVTAPTRAMLRALAVEYRVTTPTTVVPNGLPLDHGPARVKEPLILAAGRVWDEAKNLTLLDAVAGDLPWPVWIAGPTCSPGAQAPDQAGTARRLGPVPESDLGVIMARAAIYVLPARYEPFGLSILEAAQAGCALVLGDIPSLRELWDGAAVFVPPSDREGLRRALQRLVSDPDRRQVLGQQARDRAMRYNVTQFSGAYLRLYHQLLAHRRDRKASGSDDVEARPCA
jgi:glycogen synthase